jgi:hypothetical protein
MASLAHASLRARPTPPADQSLIPAIQIVTPERDRYGPDSRDSQPRGKHLVFNKCSQLFESIGGDCRHWRLSRSVCSSREAAPALISEARFVGPGQPMGPDRTFLIERIGVKATSQSTLTAEYARVTPLAFFNRKFMNG